MAGKAYASVGITLARPHEPINSGTFTLRQFRGRTCVPWESDTPGALERLLRQADDNLYRAESEGRNRVGAND